MEQDSKGKEITPEDQGQKETFDVTLDLTPPGGQEVEERKSLNTS